jgi:hypothetical protein
MRSKIRMFASTAIPTDRMKPAMPASVRVTGMALKIASVISVNDQRAEAARRAGGSRAA